MSTRSNPGAFSIHKIPRDKVTVTYRSPKPGTVVRIHLPLFMGILEMLKSCKYCGKVHDSRYDCGHKPVRRKKIRTTQNSFRSTQAWKQKSLEIRERDHYLCQVCLRNLYGTINRYNNRQIEVHHIVPLIEDYDRRLDNDNLISLCTMHHGMAEDADIPREVLTEIARQQETSESPPDHSD